MNNIKTIKSIFSVVFILSVNFTSNSQELKGINIGPKSYFPQPDDIHVIYNSLVVVDEINNYWLHGLTVDNQEISFQHYPVGEGPGEFKNKPEMQVIISENGHKQCFIRDLSNFSILKVYIDSLQYGSNRYFASDTVFLPVDWTYSSRAFLVKNNLLYLSDFKNDYRFIIFNTNTRSITRKVGYSEFQLNEYEKNIRQFMLASHYAVNRKKAKIILGMYYYPRLEIFDFSGTKQHVTKIPKALPQNFSKKNTSAFTNETMNYFIDLAVTDEYIYGLWLNKSQTQIDEDTKTELLIFDWEGMLIKKISFDRLIYQLCVSNDNKKLFGIEYKNYEQPLVVYDLPEFLK
jgi:hypothetical protein